MPVRSSTPTVAHQEANSPLATRSRSGKKPTPRSPLAPPEHVSEIKADASDALRAKLLEDTSFLRVDDPKSEEKIHRQFNDGFPKSALREAVIAFVQAGWLARGEKGITRVELDFPRLRDLFGIRLQIERTALLRIVSEVETPRITIGAHVNRILNEQERLAECSDEPQFKAKRVEWLRRSIELHTTLVADAGFPGLAPILDNILWRIRIGSCIPLESAALRQSVKTEHRIIRDNLVESDDWDVKEFISKHIREPMVRALEACGIIVAQSADRNVQQQRDKMIDRCWKEVNDLFDEKGGRRASSR